MRKTSMLARMALPLIMVILGILQSVILEQLIQKHPKGDVILMAAGTYTVTATINMIEGVHVYGGFAKGETSIENRVRPNAATEPWKFTMKR